MYSELVVRLADLVDEVHDDLALLDGELFLEVVFDVDAEVVHRAVVVEVVFLLALLVQPVGFGASAKLVVLEKVPLEREHVWRELMGWVEKAHAILPQLVGGEAAEVERVLGRLVVRMVVVHVLGDVLLLHGHNIRRFLFLRAPRGHHRWAVWCRRDRRRYSSDVSS